MASIIIIGNGAPQSKQELLMASIASLPTEAFMIKGSQESGSNGFVDQLRSSLEKSTEEDVLILDGRFSWTREQIASLSEQSLKHARLAVLSDPEFDSLEGALRSEDIISLCHVDSRWPRLALLISRKCLQERLDSLRIEASDELIPRCLIDALSQNEEIAILDMVDMTAEQLEEARSLCSIAPASLSSLLRNAVNSLNIEDLFPQHNWDDYAAESAAAGYHTISAQFIRLGDCPAALEAVALGDTLEDSPRSLALKGLIAQMQGETLQAVANMVSSLQEYEKRKRDTEQKHFISFAPENLEGIQSELRSGLEALNKRDNGSALLHFRSAVFQFDPFYTQMGLIK
jgi:hypothetical protein